MFSTGQKEFKASYKLFEREDGNLMGCTVGNWRDIRLSDFGLNLGWQVRSSSNECVGAFPYRKMTVLVPHAKKVAERLSIPGHDSH